MEMSSHAYFQCIRHEIISPFFKHIICIISEFIFWDLHFYIAKFVLKYYTGNILNIYYKHLVLKWKYLALLFLHCCRRVHQSLPTSTWFLCLAWRLNPIYSISIEKIWLWKSSLITMLRVQLIILMVRMLNKIKISNKSWKKLKSRSRSTKRNILVRAQRVCTDSIQMWRAAAHTAEEPLTDSRLAQ